MYFVLCVHLCALAYKWADTLWEDTHRTETSGCYRAVAAAWASGWEGASLSLQTPWYNLVLCRLITDYIYHLSVKYPQREGWQTQGCPAEAQLVRGEPDTPRPGWLSVGTLPCPCASRTSLHHIPSDLRPVFLGSCSGQPCPSVSLHVTRNQGKYRRNQSSEGPCDLLKPPSWGLAVLRWWKMGDNLAVEQSEDGPSVSVQGRVNEGGLGPGGADVGPRRLKDGWQTGRGAGPCPA